MDAPQRRPGGTTIRGVTVPRAPQHSPISVRSLLQGEDDYGIALLLILATIITLATVASGGVGQFAGIILGGGTLLFVLRTSGARRRTLRAASVLVIGALVLSALSIATGSTQATALWRGVGFVLAFVAPLAIFRRILSHVTITARTIMGALCIYLLIGLAFAYIFSILQELGPGPFFVQLPNPTMADFVYFSYVTLATVGYGDLTAAQPFGRMIAVSDALVGQLYLVSAVALLVGNVGRQLNRRAGADARDFMMVESVGDPEPSDARASVATSNPAPAHADRELAP